MKVSAQLSKILFQVRTATAPLNIFLKIKEVQKQLREALKIFTNAYHMFLRSTKNLKALLFVTCEKKEINLLQMISRVSGFFKL